MPTPSGSSARSSLERLIVLGEAHLRSATSAYLTHYNGERNHQGMDNQLLTPQVLPADGLIRRRRRVGGLLGYYYREAA
jgi:hypothetical protein